MKNPLNPKNFIKIAYSGVFLIIFLFSTYLYFFFLKNVYESVYFDQAKYPQTAVKESVINESKLKDVINKIDSKKNSQKNVIVDMFK